MPSTRISEKLFNEPWAIEKGWFKKIIAIADRESDIEALEAKLGKPLEYTYEATQRGNTAIIPIDGPIFPKAGVFSRMSGATSLAVIAQDFQAAIDNNDIDNIVLKIDSPGGSIVGIDEMYSLIANSPKKVISHVTGMGASSAYWIASASDEISISPVSMVGSIGIVHVIQQNVADGEASIIEFVSSVSPRKRLDPETDEGKAAIMDEIDDIAEVFVSNVADGRDTSPEDVIQNFGKGGMLIGQAAFDAGMVDRVGTFEELMASLSGQTPSSTTSSYGDYSMDKKELKAEHRKVYDAVLAEGQAAAEQETSTVVDTLQADNKALQQENTDLKAAAEQHKTEQKQASDRLKFLEDKDAIRDAKALEAKANGITDGVLATSNIPASLHSRVRASVDYNKFVAEEVLDEAGFTTAMEAEVKVWDANFKDIPAPLANFGTGGDEGETNNDTKAVEDAANSLLAHVQ